MIKPDYTQMINRLKDKSLKEYEIEDFERYCLTEDEWNNQKSKRARSIRQTYIVVYGMFEKRLLARTFYLEQGFAQKQRYSYFTEVERQLAGCPYILTKRLFTMMGSQGYRVWKGADEKGWQVHNQGSHEIYEIYYNWTGETYSYVQTYNNWRPFLKKSIHKYSAYELIPNEEQHNNYMFKYLLMYEKHPQIEMLVKNDMFHLLKKDLKYIRWSKKGPAMLGVTKQEVKYLQSGITLQDYRKVQKIAVENNLSINECKKALEFDTTLLDDVRAIRFVASKNVSVRDYEDYRGFLTLLGVPKENKYLYPDNFKEEHDRRMKEVDDHKDELISKLIGEYAEDLKELSYSENGLTIIPAKSQGELILESKELDHCVRTYAEKVSKRQTAIFFVREEENIEKPYVTLELKGQKILQCRAKHNAFPNKKTIEFVRHWAQVNQLECNL